MRKFYLLSIILVLSCSCQQKTGPIAVAAHNLILSANDLQDKIKGGWAGQVIGCTFGGPTEFGHPGTMIGDYQKIPWDSTRVSWYFEHSPGLYDDVYMDLTFMEVMEKEGIDAPATSHARAFADAPYPLWHANQAARYNILNGIMPPESGGWMNNPHAEDIDFQIEADFAGLMSPGMPNSAAEICDRVGHIMNYGDGWYGGVYMAAMYSLAFISNDVEYVVEEGLKAIPAESAFYRCIHEVIEIFHKNPDDWKAAWFIVERNWAEDIGCPDGVFRPFNIDARVNGAYVAIGLLYGKGDFATTLDISTRCGQDSDCNPASAGGILGTMIGYRKIPVIWTDALKPIENKPFSYTSLSLNRVYQTGYKQALEMISRGGGTIDGDNIQLPDQPIHPVKLEVNFPGLAPVERKYLGINLKIECNITFEGTGFILTGQPAGTAYGSTADPFAFQVECVVDDKPAEVFNMPVNYLTRRPEVAWKYTLESGQHNIRLKILNAKAGEGIRINDLIIYRKTDR
ncbi:MAG: ADP-ribosylglycohydrolase family protein [Bacteroidales bacterium]